MKPQRKRKHRKFIDFSAFFSLTKKENTLLSNSNKENFNFEDIKRN